MIDLCLRPGLLTGVHRFYMLARVRPKIIRMSEDAGCKASRSVIRGSNALLTKV